MLFINIFFLHWLICWLVYVEKKSLTIEKHCDEIYSIYLIAQQAYNVSPFSTEWKTKPFNCWWSVRVSLLWEIQEVKLIAHT